MNDGLLSKDQIASYFQKIQEGLKKDEEREAAAAAAAFNNKPSFSIGTPGISKRSRGLAATAKSNQQECNKSPLFSSQCSPSPPPSSSSEEQQQPELSSSERCLALLGIKPIPPPQTQEQIEKSRLEREQEIMKQYEDLKQKAEAKAKLRPLVWDKPTFCPYGGEIKSDDDDDDTTSSSSSSSNNNNKTKKRSRSDDVEEPYAMSSQMTNLLSCSSSKRHNNMLRQACSNMYGMMPSSYSSSTYKTSWTKEEVDAFVEFTDKWILPPKKKKVKVDE
jgi:hypothetical protein